MRSVRDYFSMNKRTQDAQIRHRVPFVDGNHKPTLRELTSDPSPNLALDLCNPPESVDLCAD